MAKKMDHSEWLRHEEYTAAKDLISIGIGDDLVTQTGLSKETICRSITGVFHDLIDGGMNFIKIGKTPTTQALAYVRRRGNRMVDVGTRVDLEALGWKDLLDACDAEIAKLKGGAR